MSSTSEQSVFRRHVERYDALIDWPKRLDNETPFYRHVFEEFGVRRVLDAACGTGRHARMFHEWGLEVEGADVSPAMISWCRRRYGEPKGLCWIERPFTQPVEASGAFDAVICVGNSLALADDSQTIEPAMAAMLSSLRPGGVCIVQVLNLWRLPDGLTQWQKCVRTRLDDGEHVLLKSIRRAGSVAFIELLDVELLADGGANNEIESNSFLGLRAEDLTSAAQASGAYEIAFFGDYKRTLYSPASSQDLIMVCRRGK